MKGLRVESFVFLLSEMAQPNWRGKRGAEGLDCIHSFMDLIAL